MRLVTFEHNGISRAGLLEDDAVVELPELPDHVTSWLADWSTVRERVASRATRRTRWGLDQVRIGLPLRPRRMLATGTNYREHVQEMGATAPGAPSAFLKLPGCELGPGEPLLLSDTDRHVDYEGELALIIGAPVRDATPAQARDAIAGLMLANDISWRDVPLPHVILGKGRPRSCPLGPAIVSTDELDLADVGFTVSVNTELRQRGHTSSMIHPFEEIVRWYSKALTLHPGDVILTGTTAGVGIGRTPPIFLVPGDTIVVSSPQLGQLETPVRSGDWPRDPSAQV